jgi:hypothetical protein
VDHCHFGYTKKNWFIPHFEDSSSSRVCLSSFSFNVTKQRCLPSALAALAQITNSLKCQCFKNKFSQKNCKGK